MGELPPSPPSTAVSTPWGDTTLVRGGGCEGRGGGEELPLSPPSTGCLYAVGGYDSGEGGEGVRGGGGGEELPLSPPSTAVSTPWGDTTLVRV